MIATTAATGRGTVELRDQVDFQVVTTISAHDGDVTGVAYSNDGARVATTGSE